MTFVVWIGPPVKGSHSLAIPTASSAVAPACSAPSANSQPEPIAMKGASSGPVKQVLPVVDGAVGPHQQRLDLDVVVMGALGQGMAFVDRLDAPFGEASVLPTSRDEDATMAPTGRTCSFS
ncbi:hypothetical protein ACG873_31665 [Mesorhizobium sp. AaZ16]|uniref:hypothetical protein n=1 Tax=Mesorhizobium sp. AaZ16 TaxID=3402289 RepID=UPI00374F75D6